MGRGMTRTARKIKQTSHEQGWTIWRWRRDRDGKHATAGGHQHARGSGSKGKYSIQWPASSPLRTAVGPGQRRSKESCCSQNQGSIRRWAKKMGVAPLAAFCAGFCSEAPRHRRWVRCCCRSWFCLVARKALSRADAVDRRSLANHCGAKTRLFVLGRTTPRFLRLFCVFVSSSFRRHLARVVSIAKCRGNTGEKGSGSE